MNAFAPMPFSSSPMDSGGVNAMPHNLEAEQALLGSLMFDNAVFERLNDRLRGSHFYEPFHQRLFDAIEAPADWWDRFENSRKLGEQSHYGVYTAELSREEINKMISEYVPSIPLAHPAPSLAFSERVTSYPASPVNDEVYNEIELSE